MVIVHIVEKCVQNWVYTAPEIHFESAFMLTWAYYWGESTMVLRPSILLKLQCHCKTDFLFYFDWLYECHHYCFSYPDELEHYNETKNISNLIIIFRL